MITNQWTSEKGVKSNNSAENGVSWKRKQMDWELHVGADEKTHLYLVINDQESYMSIKILLAMMVVIYTGVAKAHYIF